MIPRMWIDKVDSGWHLGRVVGRPLKPQRALLPSGRRETVSRERDLHQILAPNHGAVELLPDLVDDLLADARLIDLGEDVGEHQGLHACALRDHSVVPVVPAGLAIARRRFGPAEVTVHMDEHVAAPCEFDQLLANSAAVAGVTHRALIAVEAKRELQRR